MDKPTFNRSNPPTTFDAQDIVVYGGGGHSKAVIDLLRGLGTYSLVGIVDDSKTPGDTVLGVPVLGDWTMLKKFQSQGLRCAVNAVGGIGNIDLRLEVFKRIADAGLSCPTLVHPMAFVEPSAQLSAGVQVFAFAYIGSDVSVGFGSLINTSAILSHDCHLGESVILSPGATLAGGVKIGNHSLVGMGATINLGLTLAPKTLVGNGATVKADVPEGAVVHAGSIWPPRSI